MLTTDRLSPNALSLTFAGVITADDIKAMQAAFAPLVDAEDSPSIRLLVDLVEIEDVSARAVAEDLRFEASLLPHLSRFSHMAVVTDKEWVSALSQFGAHLMPKLDLRIHGSDAREAARNFVLGAEDGAPSGPAITMIETGHPDLIAYEIDGHVSEEDLRQLMPVFEAALERGRTMNLLVRLRNYGGFDPQLLFTGPIWSVKLAAIRNLHRYALVGAPSWMETVAHMAQPLTAVDMRCFGDGEEDEAWDWVRAGLCAPDAP